MLRQLPNVDGLSRRALLKYLASSSLLMAAGCSRSRTSSPPAVSASAATRPGVSSRAFSVRVAFLNYPDSLDPARARSIEAVQCAYTLYDALTYIEADMTPAPLLATNWQTAADRLSWTFELQRNVQFHNGALLTAADVAYTFNRILDPALESTIRIVFDFVERVEALDEYTVRFVLSSANADLPLLVGLPLTGIVPNGMTSVSLAARPVGVGAWRIAELVTGESIRFVRNLDYWNPEFIMQFETLEYRYFPTTTDQVEAMLASEIDLIADVPPSALNDLAEHPDITVQEVPSGRYQAIVMRADLPPFDDPRVQEAMKLCVDRTSMRSQVLADRGVIASDQPIAPVHPFWAELPSRPYDPEQARQLLLQAGYANGLKLTLITAAVEPGMVEMAQLFQTMALPAGIAIDVVTVPSDVYLTDYAGRAPLHVVGWGMRPSTDETLTTAYHSKSPANYGHDFNPQLDRMIEDARSESEPSRRAELYRAIQELIMQESSTIIPYFRPVLMAVHNTLGGFSSHPTGWLDYSGVHPVVQEE